MQEVIVTKNKAGCLERGSISANRNSLICCMQPCRNSIFYKLKSYVVRVVYTNLNLYVLESYLVRVVYTNLNPYVQMQ